MLFRIHSSCRFSNVLPYNPRHEAHSRISLTHSHLHSSFCIPCEFLNTFIRRCAIPFVRSAFVRSFSKASTNPSAHSFIHATIDPIVLLWGGGGGGVEPDAAFPTLLSDVPSSSIWEPSIHRRPASPSAEGAGRRLPWERCRSLRAGAGRSSSSQWAWPSSVAPPRKTDFAMGMIDGGTVRHTRQVCQMIRDWPVLSSMTLVCC